MIELQSVSKRYKTSGGTVNALDEVSLKIERGRIFGIIGPSGAGKSTLIRLINMLERPTEGKVIVDGEDITVKTEKQLRQLRKEIGMIFQQFNLLASRTVAENIAFPMEIAGVKKSEIDKRIKELLPLVGLEEKANVYVSNLSGGQKQRVGIARALANKPKILLCDEATSALDPQTTDSILQLISDINKKLGITVVLITHEMNVIKEICDDVAFIQKGGIIEQGSVLDVFTQPKTDIVRDFVKSILDGEKQKNLVEQGVFKLSKHGMLAQISFVGETSGEPLISTLVKEYAIDVNILFGNIDMIKDTPFGTLLVEFVGDETSFNKSVDYLRSCNVEVEVLHNV